MERVILAAGILLLLLSLGILFYVRRSLVVYSRELMGCLDKMLKDEDVVFAEEKDSLTGKIQVKMRQLYEASRCKREEQRVQKEQLETMIADLSHQIKTPIAGIRMYNDFLEQEHLPPEKRREFLTLAQRQVDKLEFLIESMMKMSRLESGLIRIYPKQNPVRPLIEQAVCDAALKAEKKQMEFYVQCPETLQAWFDRKWTGEALFNLLDNAVKYTPSGGKIQILVKKTDFYVQIQVKDNGKGIPESRLTDIFKRFYREPEVCDEEGVGIGLYLSREIIQKEKGFLEVRSEVGKGSSFLMNLPVREH